MNSRRQTGKENSYSVSRLELVLLFSFFSLVVIMGCVNSPQESRENGLVKVSVFDSSSSVPIGNAVVVVYNLEGETVEWNFTGAQGMIGFDLPAGNYSLLVNASGYDSQEKEVEVDGEVEVEVGLVSQAPCLEDWECTPWSECVNGVQTRNCTDFNRCGTVKEKPDLVQSC